MSRLSYKLIAIILLGYSVIVSCNSNKEDEYILGSKLELISKDTLPFWVREKVDSLENQAKEFVLRECIYQGNLYYRFTIRESQIEIYELIFDSHGVKWKGSIIDLLNEVDNFNNMKIIYTNPPVEVLKDRIT